MRPMAQHLLEQPGHLLLDQGQIADRIPPRTGPRVHRHDALLRQRPQRTSTEIRFGFESSAFGSVNSRTPSLKTARTFSCRTVAGKAKERWKLPYARSIRR